jgi:hypothetical protein
LARYTPERSHETPAHEPLRNFGAVQADGACRARADELTTVTSRRTETDVPLVDGSEAGKNATRRLVRFEAQGEDGAAEGSRGTLIVQDLQFEVEVISVWGAVITLSLPSDAPVSRCPCDR